MFWSVIRHFRDLVFAAVVHPTPMLEKNMAEIVRGIVRANWTRVLTGEAAPTASPLVVGDGFALNDKRRGEFNHVAAVKTAAVTLVIWGWITDAAEWFVLETFAMATAGNEAEPLQVASVYDSIYIQVTVIGGGTVDVWFGEGE